MTDGLSWRRTEDLMDVDDVVDILEESEDYENDSEEVRERHLFFKKMSG